MIGEKLTWEQIEDWREALINCYGTIGRKAAAAGMMAIAESYAKGLLDINKLCDMALESIELRETIQQIKDDIP